MEELCIGQTVLGEKIARSIINGRKTPLARRTIGFYENKIAELKRLWLEFDNGDTKLRTQVLASKREGSHEYFTKDIHAGIDEKYVEYLGELTDNLRSLQSNSTEDPLINQTSIHTSTKSQYCPRINLPKFEGDYSTWQSFRDLFVSIVDENEYLAPVQKLHHLKGCLIGEAERLLRHFPITNDNYKPAWETLKERYENKRVLVNTQLKILTNQIKSNTENSKSIKEIMDTTQECLQQLSSLQVDTSSWDVLLIHLIVQKLPFVTLRLWEEELGASTELPTFKRFQEFLQTRFRVLESMANTIDGKHTVMLTTKAYYSIPANKCPACGQEHYVGTCPKFQKMQPLERRQIIQNSNRCFNCFSGKHIVNKCKSMYRCKICKGSHHSLLHLIERREEYERNATKQQAQQTNIGRAQQPISANHNKSEDKIQTFFTDAQNALLATAVVEVEDANGKGVQLRCLIDPGSQTSFISKDICKRLEVRSKPTNVRITGLNNSLATRAHQRVKLMLYSQYKNKARLTIDMLVVDKIAESLPSTTIQPNKWNHLKGIPLADTQYWQPGPVHILLGANAYANMLLHGLRKGPDDAPIAINTIFGWVIMGNTHDSQTQQSTSFVNINDSTEELNIQLRKFWEVEEVYYKPTLNPEDEECEQHYRTTHERLETGQYQVELPFKTQSKPSFGPSRHLALKRFKAMQYKLPKNTKLKEEYSACLDEYITLEHMEKVNKELEPDNQEYYIPHHAVVKESTTTRVRVVFDASAKSGNGKSLNEQLLTGPTIQPKLASILFKFRLHKIAMMADIEKMYRMVLVNPKHRIYQQIIWEDPKTRAIEDYQLSTLTFGTASAPYLAIRTLQQLGHDERKNFPLAAKIIKTDFYVDDMLTGADTVVEALKLQDQCINMLKKGKFNLRKWASNSAEILHAVPPEQREIKTDCEFTENDMIKTLGLKWSPAGDYFTYAIKTSSNEDILSKRKILSKVAALYDPLGWIAPVIITAKILLQTLWITGCTWDDQVNETIQREWAKFRSKLPTLEKLKIPRWTGISKNTHNIQIHGFCDASNKAYAAVVYIRIEGDTRQTQLIEAAEVAATDTHELHNTIERRKNVEINNQTAYEAIVERK